MAEIRFNYGDKFTQPVNNNVGIGSTIPAVKLDIAGGTSAGSLRVSGIATLSSYQGFVNTKLTTPTEGMIVEAGQSGSVSGEVVIGTGQTISVSTGATTGQGGIQSLKVSQTFMPPVGGTADRPTDVKPGMVYYNKDFKTIEFWDGNFWKQVDNTTTRGRGVFGGGLGPGPSVSTTLTIDFINIHSQGNALDFGNLTGTYRGWICAVSNGTRGVWNSGSDYGGSNLSAIIDYVTIASEGDAIDFGDPSFNSFAKTAFSSTTRGVWGGGWDGSSANVNTIEYIEIATLGNALDFGDLAQATRGMGSSGNQIRGIFAGGQAANDNSNFSSDIDFVTIASKGNATSFGNLTSRKRMDGGGQVSNSIKGLFWNTGGSTTAGHGVDSITIASEGNAVFFADGLTNESVPTCTSNKTRGVFAGGYNPAPTSTNAIDFVQFSTSGQVFDFGDLTEARMSAGGCSDSHGGLGGF